MPGSRVHVDVTTIGDFVRRLRAEPRHALLALRALALSLGSDVVERVESARVAYLRRERVFLVVEPLRARLVAAFPADIEMNDPLGRLLRRGDERYFRLDSGDLDAHVQQFVREAYAAAR